MYIWNMDLNTIGCIAEYQFAVEAMKRGFFVSFPLLDASPYDCILDNGKDLKKIQIKSVTKDEETIRCYVKKMNNKAYSKKEVDYFAIYVQHHNGFYVFKNNSKIKSITLGKNIDTKKYFNKFVFT